MLRYPPTAPPPVVATLDVLAATGKLSGVAPQVLAAMCRFTSNYGQPALAINATGFGGFFGQHVGWVYPGRPQGFTRTELLTPLTFGLQAQVAAATLVSYKQPTLGEALSTYARGTIVGWPTTGLVTYVQQATGAAVHGPVTAPPAPPAPPQEEDTTMLTALAVGGQIHLWVTTPAAKTVRHWWQATQGPTAGKWKGPENLPS